MNKLHSLIAFIGLAATINTHTMDPVRHPMFKLIDTFIGNETLGTTTNWDAIFAVLKKLAQEGNAFTVNEYFSPNNTTLLYQAAEDNNFLAVKRLLAIYHAKPNAAAITGPGMTPLMIACLNGNVRMVRILIEYGANPYIKNKQRHDSFYFAEKYYQLNRNIQNRTILNILRTYREQL